MSMSCHMSARRCCHGWRGWGCGSRRDQEHSCSKSERSRSALATHHQQGQSFFEGGSAAACCSPSAPTRDWGSLIAAKHCQREGMMRPMRSIAAFTLSSCALLASTCFVCAADVTAERLLNPEPQNWLMNHRTYDGQRFSPLARINKENIKNLKLAYAVPLGGGAGNEWLEATPLVEDGFLYLTDVWACSTRSTVAPAIWAASSGVWSRSKSGLRPTA